ncbi:MAG: UPF0175 family protein [Bryobacteraceae bacterium]|jgi:hypothetical protein
MVIAVLPYLIIARRQRKRDNVVVIAAMQITVELPEDIARHLGASHPDLSRAALEALAVEGARSGELTTAQVRRLMGFATRAQVDAFLKAHEVFLPVTAADVERDAETSRAFRRQWSL